MVYNGFIRLLSIRKKREQLKETILIINIATLLDEMVTISIGVVTDQTLPDCNFARQYQKADEALYAAKKAGGNQVVFYYELKKTENQ